MDILAYLHIATPLTLSLPFLTLLPPPPEDLPELPGIRPITIRTVTPRRSFTLLTLSLLAVSSALDAAILVGRIATAANPDEAPSGWPLYAEAAYAFGGLCIWALTAIVVEWRARWGDQALLVLGTLGMVCEIPNLVFLVIKEIHSVDDERKIFYVLSIPPSALRLLLLPILLVIVSNPVIRFEPAGESTGLLTDQDGAGASIRNRQAPIYGTFDGAENGGQSSKAGSSSVSTVEQGAATPATTQQQQQQKQPVIPKKLGEVKKEDRPLTWREIAIRLRKLSPHLWPSTSKKLQFYVLLCMVFVLAIRVANPLVPITLGKVVQSLTDTQEGKPNSPWFYFGSYIGLRYLVGGNGLFSFANNVLWVPISQYTDREMQMLCFNHLLNLSLAYHTKRNTGEVLKIIDRGSAINNLFQTVLFTAIPTVIDIFIAFGVFFVLYGPLLACLILAVMISYVIFSITHTNWRMTLRRVMVEKDIKQRGIVSDVLTNWESVKYFTAEDREARRFKDAILSYQETEAKVSIGFSLLSLIQYFILSLGLTIGALIIAFRILDGKASAASFVVFIQYYLQTQGPLDRFGWLYRILNQETTDAEKMFTLLAQATEVNDKPGAKELVVTDGIIEFDNVRFSYDDKVEALKGVSFTIGKGQSMALVGESGSGKSTILRLLYRFYDINSGTIRIDGQDISQVTQLSLRRAIGIVPQDSVLWNDTIGANVSYGKEGAGDEEIIAAARAAKLHERIMGFPEQYSTIVGERGVRLSGGEKQRVSLARMFLKSPAILVSLVSEYWMDDDADVQVLDEATSALDTETEREIQRALADLAKDRSSLSIAHRLSTIINSDQIVVMKEGQVIEQGGYKDLIELDGAFATMWKKQIFTEAEMVAQAEGMSTEEIAETLPDERDLIDLVDGTADEKEKEVETASTSSSKGKSKAVAVAEDAAAEKDQTVEGFAMGAQKEAGTSKQDNLVHPAVSYADAVKTTEDAVKPEVTDAVPRVNGDIDIVDGSDANPEVTTEAVNAVSVDPTASASVPDTPKSEIVESPSQHDTIRAKPVPDRPPLNQTPSDSKITFPGLPRMTSSASQQSDLSAQLDDTPSSPSASRTTSTTDLPDLSKEDKRRKRLSSLKGFVRRISDQGVSRSNSLKNLNGSPRHTPTEEVDEATALIAKHTSGGNSSTGTPGQEGDKKKKRLSLVRGKSDR